MGAGEGAFWGGAVLLPREAGAGRSRAKAVGTSRPAPRVNCPRTVVRPSRCRLTISFCGFLFPQGAGGHLALISASQYPGCIQVSPALTSGTLSSGVHGYHPPQKNDHVPWGWKMRVLVMSPCAGNDMPVAPSHSCHRPTVQVIRSFLSDECGSRDSER